jgi:hypothetical protein
MELDIQQSEPPHDLSADPEPTLPAVGRRVTPHPQLKPGSQCIQLFLTTVELGQQPEKRVVERLDACAIAFQ